MTYVMANMTSIFSSSWLMKISPIPRPRESIDVEHFFTWHHPEPVGWLEPRRVIYEHELVLFRDARFVVDIQDRQFNCPPNSFIIIPPGQWHVSWNAEQKVGHRYWCHFDWEQQYLADTWPGITYFPARPVEKLIRHAPQYVPREIAHGMFAAPHRIFDLMDRLLAKQWADNRHDRMVGRALLLELLLELLDREPHQPISNDPARSLALQVRSILEGLGTEGGEELRIRDTLAKTGYSYEYLLRVFRKAFGLTPNQFVISLRLERAKLLLRDTDQPISKIATRVGINDAAYFTEIFRRHVGILPSEFRSQ